MALTPAGDKEIFPLLPSNIKCKTADLSDQKVPGIVTSAAGNPWTGKLLWAGEVLPPRLEEGGNQFIALNFTGPPGVGSSLYYSLMYQMLKWRWHLEKVDENIEVSPTHREYYERTIATKGALEGTIKEGLRSAAQAVADYELILHDIRKYKEIMDYFTAVARAKIIKEPKLRNEKVASAEHVLKAMYADQVDIHTGASSIVQMAQTRWPTILSDFMRLTEENDTVDKISKGLGISRAEALVLKTKNDLFREWMRIFGDAVRERYQRLSGISIARQRSVEEYREWIKPYVTRFKSMKAAPPKEAFRSFFDISGQALYTNNIKLWAWQPYRANELKKAPTIKPDDFVIDPADPWTVEHYIKSPKTGLAHPDYYPWLRNEGKERKDADENVFHKTVADDIIEDIKKRWKDRQIDCTDPNELYYLFITMDIKRSGTRLPVGELEDIVFDMRMHVISQNALLVRLVELECRAREIDRYIEEMLGVKKDEKTPEQLVKEEFPELFGVKPPKAQTQLEMFKKEWNDTISGLAKPFKSASKSMNTSRPWLMKAGPYEADWDERITKQYLIPAGVVFGAVTGFLMSKMGIE